MANPRLAEHAARNAAAQIGLPVADYSRQRRAGKRWCSRGRHWCVVFAMNSNGNCASCERARHRERYHARKVQRVEQEERRG